MFDWKRFLELRHVPFREGGRHEVLVQCPFCGENDPSQHLSISLRGRGWRCLRNQAHTGKAYARLLSNLIACSEEHARQLLGEKARVLPTEDQFSSDWRRQLGLDPVPSERPSAITLPQEMKPLMRSNGRFAELYWHYLHTRGYSPAMSGWLAKQYRLQYAMSGKWSYRLTVPIYNSAGDLMTWTARSIANAEIRYLTLNAESSVEPPGNLLLGLDFLWRVYKPRCLVVCEGPFDAMAVSAIGNGDGIWGTCLFGIQLSESQAVLLDDLSRKFDRVCLLVDPDARLKMLRYSDRLPKKCQVKNLGENLKDPGELPMLPVPSRYLKELVL